MTTSIGAALREAFLRGETILSMQFAASHGFTRQGVSDSLKTMLKAGLVASEEQPRAGRGRMAIVWTCTDLDAMKAFVPKLQTNNNPRKGVCQATGPFVDLLHAWGIRTVHLDLPSTLHVMRGSWA